MDGSLKAESNPLGDLCGLGENRIGRSVLPHVAVGLFLELILLTLEIPAVSGLLNISRRLRSSIRGASGVPSALKGRSGPAFDDSERNAVMFLGSGNQVLKLEARLSCKIQYFLACTIGWASRFLVQPSSHILSRTDPRLA